MLRITILGRLYQITRQFPIWRYDRTLHPLTCLLATFPLLTNAVYSSYDAGKTKPNRDLTCMAGIPNWSQHAPSAMRVHFRIHNRLWPINGRKTSSSFTPGVCVNMSAKFCVLDIFFNLTPPAAIKSWSHKIHASNTSSMEECVCRTAVHLDFTFIVSQTSKRQHLLQQQCLLDTFWRCHHFRLTTAQRHWSLTTTVSMQPHAFCHDHRTTRAFLCRLITCPVRVCVDFQSLDQLFSPPVITVTHLKHGRHVLCALDVSQKSFQFSHLQRFRIFQLRTQQPYRALNVRSLVAEIQKSKHWGSEPWRLFLIKFLAVTIDARLVQFWRNTPLALTHLQLFQCRLEKLLVRDARQFPLVTHFHSLQVLITATPDSMHILHLNLFREKCQQLCNNCLLPAPVSVIHVKLNHSIGLTHVVECLALWMRFHCETSLPCFLASENGIKVLLPRPCTLATSIDHSDRPPHAITMFLNLLRWRFQKNKFVLPSMRVRRRHIEREHALVLKYRLELDHSSHCRITGCSKHRRVTCAREVFDHISWLLPVLFIHPTCIEHLSHCCHRCLSTPPFNNSSLSPLVDLHHSRCMNLLGAPQSSGACIEFVCLFQIWPLGSSLDDLLLIAAIVASRFSRFETVSSSVNDRRAGCLLLNLRRACSSAETPSSWSICNTPWFAPSSLTFAVPASSKMFCSITSVSVVGCRRWSSELPGMGSSRVASCPVVVVLLACAGDPSFLGRLVDGLGGSPSLTVAFLNISGLPLNVSHDNTCNSEW